MSWTIKLSRPIALENGRTLTTLREASDELIARYQGVRSPEAVAHALELLMTARDSGDPIDIAKATEHVARSLPLKTTPIG